MMRNLDLDQFWPIPPRSSASSPVAPVADRIEALAPPPLPAPPLPPAVSAPDLPPELEASPDLIVAASAGWIESEPSTLAEPPQVTASAPPALEQAVHQPIERAIEPDALDAPLVTEAPETSAVRARRRDYTPLLWGCTGFVAGMLAWHVVGFWSFVSNVVLNANDPRAQTLEAFLPQLNASAPFQKAPAPVSVASKPLVQQVAKAAGSETPFACVALAIDRTAGGTKVDKCKGGAADLRDAGFNKKTDKLVLRPRLQDPVAWTGSTAVQVTEVGEPAESAATTEAEQTNVSGTLSEADLKLDVTKTGLTIPHEPD